MKILENNAHECCEAINRYWARLGLNAQAKVGYITMRPTQFTDDKEGSSKVIDGTYLYPIVTSNLINGWPRGIRPELGDA